MKSLAPLALTLLIAVVISLTMWVAGAVPFNLQTFLLHVVSIYIGVAGILLFQLLRKED